MKRKASGTVVIAGITTGSGKTTVSMALMRLLAMNGIQVSPFKVGPDFIDPKFHEVAAGSESINLDGFMTSADYIRKSVAMRAAEGSFCIIEGMMGLFDGLSARRDFASTAWVSKVLNAPVILAIDVSSTMRTAAAVAWGVREFSRRKGVRVEGVILNRTNGEGHFEGCRNAIEASGVRVLGHIPDSSDFTMVERHLGLALHENMHRISSSVDAMANALSRSLDLRELINMASRSVTSKVASAGKKTVPKVLIGIATDFAFNFYYRDNVELLRRAGADMVPFSPINDSSVSMFDGVYIGGGYPELYAGAISRNSLMLSGLKKAAEDGMPIYSECGGFMMLCNELVKGDRAYRMAGVFDAAVEMTSSPVIGYRKIRTNVLTPLGRAGVNAKGHEFHYASVSGSMPEGEKKPFLVWKNDGANSEATGFLLNNAVGSFLHLHFGSNRSIAQNIVSACLRYSKT